MIKQWIAKALAQGLNLARTDGNAAAATVDQYLQKKVAHLEAVCAYLEYQVSHLSSLMRHLSADLQEELLRAAGTRQSFDFQWDKLPNGAFMLESSSFRKAAAGYVMQYTGLPREWFPGKAVIDVGCGLGRYSWALGELGANVLSADQSGHGLRRTKEACREHKGHRTVQINLLKPLPIQEQFDLVWCYGVLHHTGNTYAAFKHIVPLVKPGGYLFLMIYGEPRPNETADYAAVNEYEFWRRRTANMDLNETLDVIKKGMCEQGFAVNGEEHIHGYFDAISPPINDLYTFEELEGWLIAEGFEDITRTVNARNHHIIAQKK